LSHLISEYHTVLHRLGDDLAIDQDRDEPRS
jgi:hypothetical protein